MTIPNWRILLVEAAALLVATFVFSIFCIAPLKSMQGNQALQSEFGLAPNEEPPPPWILPFDDSYIFIRYAQQAHRGQRSPVEYRRSIFRRFFLSLSLDPSTRAVVVRRHPRLVVVVSCGRYCRAMDVGSCRGSSDEDSRLGRTLAACHRAGRALVRSCWLRCHDRNGERSQRRRLAACTDAVEQTVEKAPRGHGYPVLPAGLVPTASATREPSADPDWSHGDPGPSPGSPAEMDGSAARSSWSRGGPPQFRLNGSRTTDRGGDKVMVGHRFPGSADPHQVVSARYLD